MIAAPLLPARHYRITLMFTGLAIAIAPFAADDDEAARSQAPDRRGGDTAVP